MAAGSRLHGTVLACLLSATLGAAWADEPADQAPAPAGPPVMSVTGAMFALSVADMKASTEWYTDKFGLKVVLQTPETEGASATVLEGGGLIVELIHHASAVALNKAAPQIKEPMLVHGLAKAGVIVTDFDKTLAALKERSVRIRYGPYPAKPGQRANVIIEDNAGNLIQIFGTS